MAGENKGQKARTRLPNKWSLTMVSNSTVSMVVHTYKHTHTHYKVMQTVLYSFKTT